MPTSIRGTPFARPLVERLLPLYYALWLGEAHNILQLHGINLSTEQT